MNNTNNDSAPQPENDERLAALRVQAHLLGEAFPDKFTITLVITRNSDGTLDERCDIVCNPQTSSEFNALHSILNAIGAKP